MQHIFARALAWQDGAGDTQESQLLVPADLEEAGDTNHDQLTSLTEEDARPRVRFLATVPEEPEEDGESAGCHEDLIHEHLVDDASPQTGFCRDHRGKLQSMWELCEDVARDAQDCGEEPDNRLISGALELRGSVTRRTSSDRQATCTIQHGVITFRGAVRPDAEMVVLAEVPILDIIVTIVPDQTRKFSICNPGDIDNTQVWCCAKNQKDRDNWLAVLQRLGVDLYCERGDGEFELVQQGVQALPGDNQGPRSVR